MSTRSGEHRIRDDLSVEFTFDPSRPVIETKWYPGLPSKLGRDELPTYRSARNRFLERVIKQIGGSVLVIE